MDYYSFDDPGGMEGWVGLVGLLYSYRPRRDGRLSLPGRTTAHLPTQERRQAELAWSDYYDRSTPRTSWSVACDVRLKLRSA